MARDYERQVPAGIEGEEADYYPSYLQMLEEAQIAKAREQKMKAAKEQELLTGSTLVDLDSGTSEIPMDEYPITDSRHPGHQAYKRKQFEEFELAHTSREIENPNFGNYYASGGLGQNPTVGYEGNRPVTLDEANFGDPNYINHSSFLPTDYPILGSNKYGEHYDDRVAMDAIDRGYADADATYWEMVAAKFKMGLNPMDDSNMFSYIPFTDKKWTDENVTGIEGIDENLASMGGFFGLLSPSKKVKIAAAIIGGTLSVNELVNSFTDIDHGFIKEMGLPTFKEDEIIKALKKKEEEEAKTVIPGGTGDIERQDIKTESSRGDTLNVKTRY